MSKFIVTVDDPAYPPGTKLSVAGVKVEFENNTTHEVDDSDIDPNILSDAKTALSNVAGFTVSEIPALTDPPVVSVPSAQPQVAPVANELTTDGGGEN